MTEIRKYHHVVGRMVGDGGISREGFMDLSDGKKVLLAQGVNGDGAPHYVLAGVIERTYTVYGQRVSDLSPVPENKRLVVESSARLNGFRGTMNY